MKKLSCLLVICLILPLILVGCDETHKNLTTYKIIGEYDENSHTLTCSQEVVYVNNSDNSLSCVKFFLYPNSFKEVAVSSAYLERAYPNGESFGDINFTMVMAGEKECEYSVNDEGSILTIQIDEIFPEESVLIRMEYVVTLANANHRLGYGDNAINFGNFYPIACVYENGYVENDFAFNGDPFYSDIANYDITLSFNEKYTLATSGEVTSEKVENGKKEVKIKGEKLRDFCFVLSEKFEVVSNLVDGVKVNYYYYDDDNATENLEVACLALSTFFDLFGEYPYKVLNVVKTNFCFGGMEYPNLVYISDAITDLENYEYVIVHEIAHQWWYSVVGNNEYSESWLDESLTEYSTLLFYEKTEKGDYSSMIDNALNSYRLFVEVYEGVKGDVDESMNRDLSAYSTEPEYVNCVYTKGVLLYDSLRAMLGDNKFFKSLENYFDDYAFKNSSTAKLIESFSKTARMDLEGYFNSWLDGTVVLCD